MVLTDYKWKRRDEYRREGDHWKSKAETDIPAPGETLQVYPKDFRLILPESKTSLLVLKSYVELFDCTWQRWQEDPFSGVLVTGEPGTGRSYTGSECFLLINSFFRKDQLDYLCSDTATGTKDGGHCLDLQRRNPCALRQYCLPSRQRCIFT